MSDNKTPNSTPTIDPKSAAVTAAPVIDPKTGKPVVATTDPKTGEAVKNAGNQQGNQAPKAYLHHSHDGLSP